ncbi:transmembrane protein 246 [Biomphalaria glabrata]|nr:transmembrane protein 246 [Biomphalaria glabrata]
MNERKSMKQIAFFSDGLNKNLWKWLTSVCIYFTVLCFLCLFLPFSKIFTVVHSYESLFDQVEAATDGRLRAAKQYFQTQNPELSSRIYSDRLSQGNILFAIGIITIKRTKETESHESLGYLPPSVAHMDSILKSHRFFNTSLPFICNVDAFPSTHFDAVDLYKFVPYTERFGNNSLGIPALTIPKTNTRFIDLTTHSSKYSKESFDYAFCLLSAAALNPRFILLLEEDTIPHKDFPSVIEHLITFRLNLPLDHKHDFGFLKLYFPSKWQGFGFEFIKILDLLCCCILVTAVAGVYHYLRSFRSATLPGLNSVLLSAFLVTLLTCLLVGRQNINELRRLSKHFYRLQSSEGCCTQAMVYQPSIVSSMAEYLVNPLSNKHTDLAIWDFSYRNSIRTLQVEPNLFFHTGLYTTLDQVQKHPEEFIFHQ